MDRQSRSKNEETMKRNQVIAVAPVIVAVMACFALPQRMQGQDNKNPYPSMAPVDQYMMDRDAEISLARSAAPVSISRDAKVLVLGPHGYETAAEGKNGFVCLVERGWLNLFDNSEFWDPKVRGAVCYNPPAARSILPITYMRTEMVLAGASKIKIAEREKEAYTNKQLPAVEQGAMCYMMAKQSYLNDKPLTNDGAHDVAHLMFYTPLIGAAAWGANLPNSPVYLNPQFGGAPEPIDVFIVLTGTWSDGSPAPLE
jgi:hypothetical protein